MKTAHAVGLGVFILILTYLGLKNADGVGAVLVGTKVLSIDETKALQGRPVAYH